MGLTEFKIVKNTYTVTGVEERMRKYDTLTLYGNYYGAPILTGTGTDATVSLPFGIDAKGLYRAVDMKYIDDLHAIFGDSAAAGTTYTMRNDIDMETAINRLTTNQTFNAGTGGRIVLDGNEKTLTVRLGGTGASTTGLFGTVNGKFTIQKLDVKVAQWNITNFTSAHVDHGILIGLTNGTTTDIVIDQVHVDMNEQPGTEAINQFNLAGGLIGYTAEGNATITKSSVFDINMDFTADKNQCLRRIGRLF